MSGYLLDTNVVSELRRRRRDDAVVAWYASTEHHAKFLSALVIGEIRNGIERLAVRDAPQARYLADWLASLRDAFSGRIVPVDAEVSDLWGRLEAKRPLSAEDGLMAATAIVHDLTLVTRNVDDVAGTGARVINPWLHV